MNAYYKKTPFFPIVCDYCEYVECTCAYLGGFQRSMMELLDINYFSKIFARVLNTSLIKAITEDRSFSSYTKFSEKLTFITPCRAVSKI